MLQVVAAIGPTKEAKRFTPVDPSTMVETVVRALGMFIDFNVNFEDAKESQLTQSKNAFEMLMKNRRSICLPKKSNEINAKVKLQNHIIDMLEQRNLGWSNDAVGTAGKLFISTLSNALWYIDGVHESLAERSAHVPQFFYEYQGYNCPEKSRKRKRDINSMKEAELKDIVSDLYTLLGSSYFKLPDWKQLFEYIVHLTQSLNKYCQYLSHQRESMKKIHSRLQIHSDTEDWKVIEPNKEIAPAKSKRYELLIKAIEDASYEEAILLDNFCPSDRRRKFEFIEEIELPSLCIALKYTASSPHLHFLWKIRQVSNASELFKTKERLRETVKAQLPIYHSRAMKREFMFKFGTISKTSTALLRKMYKELTNDSSASANLSVQEIDDRVQQALEHEDAEITWDLRLSNKGRPEKYEAFLQLAIQYIENIVGTAVDERRHDTLHEGNVITHMATALNARTLYDEICKICPPDTPVPSIQWLKLQFWPQTAAQTKTHTGKLGIKYMIQSRQIRMNHIDTHYASAVFKYHREMACKYREDAMYICADDKHSIKVGEPDHPVAAVERGKRVLCSVNQKFSVMDHDYTKFSFSPSVHMLVNIPNSSMESFYDGKVFVGLKENCFQASSAIRHATELHKILKSENEIIKPLMFLYTDGGPDHNVTFLRTQLSLISLFLIMDLDMLCAVRTPPHQSWKNPAERVMSILNLGLQGVGVMREPTENFENLLKNCSSTSAVRKAAEEQISLPEEVIDSVQQPKALIETVFKQLKMKEETFNIFEPATSEEILTCMKTLQTLGITQVNLKKDQITKYPKLQKFLESHCKITCYMFSVIKCTDVACITCKPPRSSFYHNLHHLPDPMPAGNEHFKSFDELYGTQTSEEHRPSLIPTRKAHGMPFSPTGQTGKNTGTVIQCTNCKRWRVAYSQRKLKAEESTELKSLLEDIDFSCGASLQDILHQESSILTKVFVNQNLSCSHSMEKAFYSACFDPVCFFCGEEENITANKGPNYPMCNACSMKGLKPTTKQSRALKPK